MSMHKKLQEAMRNGVILERDRCMRILSTIAKSTKSGLDRKLMTAQEKHLAELRFKIAEAIVAQAQILVMQGIDPNAEDTPKPLHGQDTSPLGNSQGDPDRPGAG